MDMASFNYCNDNDTQFILTAAVLDDPPISLTAGSHWDSDSASSLIRDRQGGRTRAQATPGHHSDGAACGLPQPGALC